MTNKTRITAVVLLAMAATAVGAAVSPDPANTVISGDWRVDLRTVCAVGAVVVGGAWWISGTLRGLVDKLARAEEDRKRFEKHFVHLEHRMDALRCQREHGDCPISGTEN